jgi:hypothetical protein
MRVAMEMKLGASKELGSIGPYRAWFKRELSAKSVSSNRARYWESLPHRTLATVTLL